VLPDSGVVIFMWKFEETISFVYFSRIKVELRHSNMF
jgi:hypothetical protein